MLILNFSYLNRLISSNICDNGKYILQYDKKEEIKSVQDYVISDLEIGESGYGDYIIMKVDQLGIIEGWNPTLEEFQDDDED